MSIHLKRDLELLEQELLAQGSLVEKMIRLATKALKEMRSDLIDELLHNENSVNHREVSLEEECLKILALHQPVAVDLRRVATVLKVNNDLERIADLTVNVGERSQSLISHAGLIFPDNIDLMADKASGMVRDALDAFVKQNVELARDVCVRDDEVDELNRDIINELQDNMANDGSVVEAGMHYFSASRHLERIADHATNIAEEVIYLVEGEITRHQHKDLSAS